MPSLSKTRETGAEPWTALLFIRGLSSLSLATSYFEGQKCSGATVLHSTHSGEQRQTLSYGAGQACTAGGTQPGLRLRLPKCLATKEGHTRMRLN